MSPVIEICQSTRPVGVRRSSPCHRHIALRAASTRKGSAVIVAVSGEVDASNESAWSLLVAKMATVATVPGPFVVDVRNLTFMGCSAFAVLAREARQCRCRGISLYLVSNQAIVARTVAAAGLRPVLTVYPTLQMALSRSTTEPFGRG